MTFENISSTKTLETKASTSAKTSANAKTSIKGGGKTNLRTFSFFCSSVFFIRTFIIFLLSLMLV